MKIIFASHNEHKVQEIRALLPSTVQIVSLKELNDLEEIAETGTTLEENSLLKAKTIFDKYKLPVLAEDTGLEVEALDGKPGVYSARYAGEHGNSEKNMQLLLENLKNSTNRKAQFKTVATFLTENTSIHFTGVIKGDIAKAKKGTEGFGYDAIFIPAGFKRTFAEMNNNEKSLISHRAIAINQFLNYIKA